MKQMFKSPESQWHCSGRVEPMTCSTSSTRRVYPFGCCCTWKCYWWPKKIKLTNEFEIPIWPFSKGRNVGYGSTAPRVPSSLDIDMARNMNRVLKADPEKAYVLLEPGVSYFDLHEYLVKHNLRWSTHPHWDGFFAKPKSGQEQAAPRAGTKRELAVIWLWYWPA